MLLLFLFSLLVLGTAQSTQDDANKIINFLTQGAGKGQTWQKLADLVDATGHRLCGSPDYDNAVNYVKAQLMADGLQNVHGELAPVPRWVRGQEYLTMLSPRRVNMSLLGLGSSIGTQAYGPDGITGEVVVVTSFADLDANAAKALGRIVVYNQYCNWTQYPTDCYDMSIDYRTNGAAYASQYGAVATLVRSLTGFSIYTVHTGVQEYDNVSKPIPTASISVEDAEMLQRMYNKGEQIILQLQMGAQTFADVQQENVIAEIKGSVWPDEVVIVSGHLDSWDVGVGAMDDGGGAVISWQALSVLRQLGIQPKRTIRMIMWACEEFAGIGANSYYANHHSENGSISIAMESDMGTFNPTGIEFTGTQDAFNVMQTQVMPLLSSINRTLLVTGGDGEDIEPWMDIGVPGASLHNDNDNYFWFHHTQGDRMEVEDPVNLDYCAAVWAVSALGVANLDDLLPR